MLKERIEDLLLHVETYKKELEDILKKEVNRISKEKKLIEVYSKYFNQIADEILENEKTDKEFANDLMKYAEFQYEMMTSIEDSEKDRFIVISLGLETGDTLADNGTFHFVY